MGFEKRFIKIKYILVAIGIFALVPMVANALPAFPGAQGFGSDTIGGRGGRVIKVTNLNDSGTGSLRAALTASGPRIVVFTTGGTINLSSPINIWNPFVTVAGQTAPGGGILIRGPNSSSMASIRINTHDVVIRGLRIRDTGKAALEILGPTEGSTYNVIVDHCSMSWSQDTVTGTAGDINNIIYSWNIISEGISSGIHSAGMLIDAWGKCNNTTGPYKFSLHHNLFALSRWRQPLIKQSMDAPEVINNVIYDWEGTGGIVTFSKAYISRNYLIPGVESGSRGIEVWAGSECPTLQPGTVMVSHNIGPGRTTDAGDDWNVVKGGSNSYRTNSPPFTLSGITENDVSSLKDLVLAGAGATIPSRDSVDTRVVNNVRNGTGHSIAYPSDIGGWPTLSTGTATTDTDGDGIPDSWETEHGLNPNNSSDANQYASSQYTWIEEYINGFFPSSGDTAPVDSPPSGDTAPVDSPPSGDTAPVDSPQQLQPMPPSIIRID